MLEPGQKFYHGIYAQNWGDRAFFTAVDDNTVWYTRDVGKSVEVAGQTPYANASLCASFEQFGGGYLFAVSVRLCTSRPTPQHNPLVIAKYGFVPLPI